MTRKLRLVHLFPELLNLYADQGNLAVLATRAKLRGIEIEIAAIKLGMAINFDEADLILLGGGSDREQAIVGRELLNYRQDLVNAVEAGLPVLAVCGGYQLLGEYYELPNGERVTGLHVIDLITRAGQDRLIGNIVIKWNENSESDPKTVVGFENHGGRTMHDYLPLGTIVKGFGNNGLDQKEGVQYKGVMGTYIHGPLLPKNPHLADHLIKNALRYRGLADDLATLDDQLEWQAHQSMISRMRIDA